MIPAAMCRVIRRAILSTSAISRPVISGGSVALTDKANPAGLDTVAYLTLMDKNATRLRLLGPLPWDVLYKQH